MTYVNAVKYINSHKNGTPSPERMRLLCRYLSDPQRQLKVVHIAGGAGKTSCAQMLSTILGECGYNIGILTTSFVKEPREMISVGNNYISHNDFAKYIEYVASSAAKMKNDILMATQNNDEQIGESDTSLQHPKITKNLLDGKISPDPTASEIICAAALLAFKDKDCNISVLECGESRADPTGIIDPPLVALICGTTLSEEQLRTGVGIIRRGTREVVTSASGEGYNAVLDACVRVGSRLTVPARAELHPTSFGLSGRSFEYRGKNYSLPSCAEYQLTNALVTIETVYALRRTGVALHSEDVARALRKARIPLKFEMLSLFPSIIVDCPQATQNAISFCESLGKISSLISKEVILVCEPENNAVPSELLESYGFNVKETITPVTEKEDKQAAIIASKLKSEETMIIIGSLAFAGRVKNQILKVLSFR